MAIGWVRSMDSYGALIPNSDWGSALKGVGPVAVLEIMQVLQQRLASPQQGSCAPPRLTPDLVRRRWCCCAPDDVELKHQRSHSMKDALHERWPASAFVAYALSACRPVDPYSSCVLSSLQILDTALQHEHVEIHDSQADRAAAERTLARCLIIFGRCPVVKVGHVSFQQHPRA